MKIPSNSQSVTKEMQIKAMRKCFRPSNWPKEQMVSAQEERVLCRAKYWHLSQLLQGLPKSSTAPADKEACAETHVEAAGFQNEPPNTGHFCMRIILN